MIVIHICVFPFFFANVRFAAKLLRNSQKLVQNWIDLDSETTAFIPDPRARAAARGYEDARESKLSII